VNDLSRQSQGGPGALDPVENPDFVPEADEQTELLGLLGTLVRSRGVGALVDSLLLEPTPDYFPDPWAGGLPSVRRVLRRLMRYAGLDRFAVEVEILEEKTHLRGSTPPRPVGTGPETELWFVRIETTESRETCRFALEAVVLRDSQAFVAAAARAVAHAYRRVYDLDRRDRAEQRRIDVTTVFLGFGLLTADAALRHSSAASGGAQSQRKIHRLGTLSPQAMCFLLAVQAVVRGLDRKARKALAGRLQANQAAFFLESCVLLARRPELDRRLGLPPEDEWPEPPDAKALLAPLAPLAPEGSSSDETEEEERRDLDRGIQDTNLGKPVFRVERSMALRMGKVFGMAAFILGGFATRSYLTDGVDPAVFTMGALGLAVLGLLVGFFLRDSRCSDPNCVATLPKSASQCPRCGGAIVGVIKHPKERLAAEELYLSGKAHQSLVGSLPPRPSPPAAETKVALSATGPLGEVADLGRVKSDDAVGGSAFKAESEP